MKYAIVLLTGLVLLSLPVKAQSPTQMVNCAGLRGLPALCFKNNAQAPVTSIQTSNSMSWGSDWIPVMIPSGGTTVVKFPTGWSGCTKYMEVRTMDGAVHPINRGGPVDVCNSTTVNIGGW